MTAKRTEQSNDIKKSKKSITQKRHRRTESLEKRVFEYSKMCDADVCLGIRIKENGQVHIFSADRSGFWTFLKPHLDSCYPTPSQRTDKDFEVAQQAMD
ncbi:hypothetical protein ASPWEDRAFT_103418 [Aspergillus wentii DTO 134E9]|uniref:MADS-box domain-containing protein n=1 Tax=Aspergillus wentii DTO 134E9 TaxID=1073089 RepID=A0A1L9RV92_ASPWE|nr:uncharacterized protein ASPWEDRAFT_103418 [Aspergillus wentii DTO 134E9]OJJ38803.1 hypothetical protein ASPWEDRAFT_103418 [Aspergillus wentii DTO 134E9]